LITLPSIYTLWRSAAFPEAPERKKWFYSARSDLKRGKITSLIEHMTALSKEADGEPLKIMMTEINHLTKAHVEGRLNYAKIAALKLPIGSGAVESLVRQVVNLIMKGNGKFWLRERAEIILHARCQWTAGNWQTFSDSILTALINPG